MNILYVEDDPGLGLLLSKHLHAEKHAVQISASVAEAKQSLMTAMPDIMICDHDLPDGTGLDLLTGTVAKHANLPCIMLTGVGDEALAVAAMKAGARDYVVKDLDNNFLSLVPASIERIAKERTLEIDLETAELQNSRLEARNRYLATKLKKQASESMLIGQQSNFKKVLNSVEQVAPTDATVLITGETGTGKEMIARLVHELSSRANDPFITVNCGALPAQLIESELFGHEKGAFTGAVKSRAGRFEAAHGGTIFLDEVGELPLELQPRLLRVLQTSQFERVGSSETHSVDVRIVSATNQDLLARISEQVFREDLYYRLNVVPIHLPPLRDRESDLELLLMHFIKQIADHHGIAAPKLTSSVRQSILQYHWPGNAREMRNYVERGVVTREWDKLPATPIDSRLSPAIDKAEFTGLTLDEVDRIHITRVLQSTNGVVGGKHGAAEILGLNANTLRSKMKKLGIEKPSYSL